MTSVNGEPTQEGCRNERVARQFPDSLCREFRKLHGRRRQRVVTAGSAVRQDQNEWRRHVLAGVLPGLNMEIPVERLYAAFEACPVVLRTKRLDAQRVLGSAPHPSNAGCSAITAHRVAQSVVDRPRLEQGLHEGLAVAHRKLDVLVLLDGAAGPVPPPRPHEIFPRPAPQPPPLFPHALFLPPATPPHPLPP